MRRLAIVVPIVLCCLPVFSQSIRLENGIFRVTIDNENSRFNNLLDIQPGTSITFTRKNPTTFTVATGPMQYDENIGPLFHQFRSQDGADWHFRPYELKFDFPFYDRTLRQTYLSAYHAIYLAPPKAPQQLWYQYGPLDIYASGIGLIAPLLHAWGGQLPSYLYVSERTDSVIFTFRSGQWPTGVYDIQVLLRNDGTIVFSYKTLEKINWGVVAVTSGNESWRSTRTPIASVTDPAGDVAASVPAAARDAMDILGFELLRVGDSDLLEARITLKQPPGPSPPPVDLSYTFYLFDAANDLLASPQVKLFSDGATVLFTPGLANPQAVDIRRETDALIVPILQSAMLPDSGQFRLVVITRAGAVDADAVSLSPVQLESSQTRMMTDLSTLATATDLSKPVIEVFTRPRLLTETIYNSIKSAFALGDREVDQVAVYPLFGTEMTFYATGESNGGNATLGGAIQGQAPNQFFSPARINLNEPLKSPNDMLSGAMHLLSHEFGHRWLDDTMIMEDGTATNVLNPDSAHPAAYVHNPAAFALETAFDTSVMGGGWFLDQGNGSFRTADFRSRGYSWWELYLMGLASPSELPPWFYVRNAQPSLASGLTPAINRNYTGIRKDVTINQLIAAMGPRIPSFEESQRTFRMLFVIVEQPQTPASEQQIAAVAGYAAEFKRRFAMMTGNRGRIATGLPEKPAADFLVMTGGSVVTFTDTSQGDPSYWTWSFGDGASSTLPNPSHQYGAAGTYIVTMTVRNSRGSSSKTANVTIGAASRRRAVRR